MFPLFNTCSSFLIKIMLCRQDRDIFSCRLNTQNLSSLWIILDSQNNFSSLKRASVTVSILINAYNISSYSVLCSSERASESVNSNPNSSSENRNAEKYIGRLIDTKNPDYFVFAPLPVGKQE